MTDTEMIANVVIAAVKAATAPLLERIAVLEARAPVPGPDGPSGADGARGADGVSVTVDELRPLVRYAVAEMIDALPKPKDGEPGRDGRDGLPGIGRDGIDGKNGENGLDGLGFDDIEQIYDGERSLEFVFRRGGQMKRLGAIELPIVIDRGVFTQGKTYAKGDGVTLGGSFWIARDTTTSRPGDGATAWRLSVKAGRDGKDGKPGPQGPQGMKGGTGEAGRNYQ